MEWALIADGVPASEVYHVLQTKEGVERAFNKLDQIKPSIVWWVHGSEPLRLLESGEVAMTSVWNGRVYAAVTWHKQPLEIIWDGQVWNMDAWAMPRHSPSPDEAEAFIAFATDPKRMAEQASYLAYSPTRRSAEKQIPADVKPHLPIAGDRTKTAIHIDYTWWAKNDRWIRDQFEVWLRAEPFEYDFNPPDAH